MWVGHNEVTVLSVCKERAYIVMKQKIMLIPKGKRYRRILAITSLITSTFQWFHVNPEGMSKSQVGISPTTWFESATNLMMIHRKMDETVT